MAKVTVLRNERAASAGADLHAAFDEAMQFGTRQAASVAADRETLTGLANEEASFGRVSVDENGLTAGAKSRLLEPARALMSQWKQARAPFDRAIEPFRHDIEAARNLEARVARLRQEMNDKLSQAEEKLEQNSRYKSVKDRHDSSQALWRRLRSQHGERDANMTAHNPLYWVALLAIGCTEWLINYDVFYVFLGVPAIAAGATIIMGVLLAFAAHGHGMLLKQWSFRLGEHKPAIDRHGDLRLLAFSTFALLIVLGAAGGSRYAAVLHSTSGYVSGNLAGADAAIDVNPVRDVLLSLLANLAAWAVGVFIAFLAHDVDPDYMSATRQARLWERRWLRLRKGTDTERRTIQAQFEKRANEEKVSAESKFAAIKAQHDLFVQVERHEDALVNALSAALTSAAQTYHSIISRTVISQRGETRLFIGEKELSPYEFQAQRVAIGPELVRSLVY